MARRDINNLNTVTDVVPDQTDTLAPAVVDLGQQIIKQSQEAKIIEGVSSAQLELGKLSDDYQTKFEGDPFNEQALKDYRDQRQGIIDKYGEGISPLFGRDWQKSATGLASKSDLEMQAWGFKQSAVNAKQSLLKSVENYNNQAQIDGEAFGKSGADGMAPLLSFTQARRTLEGFGTTHLGETSTQQVLKDFDQDQMKMFLSGVAHTNPVKAVRLMDNEQVRGAFTNGEEFTKFRDAVETRAMNVAEVGKQQEVLNVLKTENNLFTGNKALTYAEIQQSTSGMSEEAKKYFMKVNGYSEEGDALKPDQKLQVKASIYDHITQLAQSDNVKPEDLQALQGAIYTGVRKGALTEDEGANFLTQLVTPAIAQKETQMSQFSAGQWNPFKDNVGFAEVQKFYSDKVEIGLTQPEKDANVKAVGKVSQAINATNKANLYDNYWNALQTQAVKRGIQVADIPQQQDRDAIYAAAQTEAQNKFLAAKSPILKVQPSIPITAIKKLLEHPEKAVEFDEMFGNGAANRILGK